MRQTTRHARQTVQIRDLSSVPAARRNATSNAERACTSGQMKMRRVPLSLCLFNFSSPILSAFLPGNTTNSCAKVREERQVTVAS